MFERIRHMLIKEFIQVFRDPRMRTVIFIIPCVQVIVIGYAVTTDVRHVPTAVWDLDNSTASRELTLRFSRSGYFDAVARIHNQREARELIDRGRALMVLQINRGFADDLRAGRTALVQVILDGTDSNTAGIVLGYVGTITSQYSQQILLSRFSPFPRGRAAARTTRFAHAGVVQREPGEPQLLRPRRDCRRGQPGLAAFDQHGRGPRKGDRHHGTDHGDAHHPRRS